MPKNQRLVYAVELVVASVLPSAHLSVHEAQTFVDGVCDAENLDAPEVLVARVGRGFAACASHERHAIVLSTKHTSALTALHELAHLLCDENEGHHEEWRGTFVRLVRRYISVEHGALLHTLYNRCGLPTAWS